MTWNRFNAKIILTPISVNDFSVFFIFSFFSCTSIRVSIRPPWVRCLACVCCTVEIRYAAVISDESRYFSLGLVSSRYTCLSLPHAIPYLIYPAPSHSTSPLHYAVDSLPSRCISLPHAATSLLHVVQSRSSTLHLAPSRIKSLSRVFFFLLDIQYSSLP